MDPNAINDALRKHLEAFFAGHICEENTWTLGPAIEVLPRLRVVEIAPGPKTDLWVYATLGAWEAQPAPHIEFVLTSPTRELQHVELLTMTAWYHHKEKLGLFHSFPIGKPWIGNSKCEFLLVSLPYPFGPDLEICELPDRKVRFLWLLPITKEEQEFKKREGIDAIEELFDAADLEYWEPNRESVV